VFDEEKAALANTAIALNHSVLNSLRAFDSGELSEERLTFHMGNHYQRLLGWDNARAALEAKIRSAEAAGTDNDPED